MPLPASGLIDKLAITLIAWKSIKKIVKLLLTTFDMNHQYTIPYIINIMHDFASVYDGPNPALWLAMQVAMG